jgi:ABC-type phosphate transport system auxiliary subunit
VNLISSALFKWYVPRSHYKSLETLAHTYLEQLEGCENEIQQAKRVVEANKIMASYIKQIALETIFDKVDDEDLETDRFYQILLNTVKASRQLREELVKDIRKIGAIALQDGDFTASSNPVDEDEMYEIFQAIANLRVKVADLEADKESLIKGQIEDLKVERDQLRGVLADQIDARDTVMAKNRNLVESLQLSQQEVKDLRSRYTERYAKVAEISVDIDRKLKELDKLNII